MNDFIRFAEQILYKILLICETTFPPSLFSSVAVHVAVMASVDPVEQFLGRALPPRPLSPDERDAARYDRNIGGLRALARDYSWGAVLELATSMLADDDDAAEENHAVATAARAAMTLREFAPPNVPAPTPGSQPRAQLLPHERLLCEAHRGLALVQTRMIDRATLFLDDLGELGPGNPKYRYESYPELYPDHAPGSFVPFEIHFLSIEIRVRKGDAAAICDCYELRERFPDHSLVLLSAMVGYHLRAQQHDTAVDLARDLVLRQGTSSRALFFYGRVLLHVGDVGEARRVFKMADGKDDATDEVRHVHRGLLLAAQGEYLRALAENDLALQLMDQSMVGADPSRHVRVFAHCNASICLMHLGRLSDSIERLEACLRGDPEYGLDEGLIFNLCTMYDLAFPDEAEDKKRVLHRLASRYGRQGFNLDMTLSANTP